ncbi:hypothetical protein [Rathayibacter sp. AY1E4]|nr:hypothetical protein [Rathayibacter sp. AY1E4]
MVRSNAATSAAAIPEVRAAIPEVRAAIPEDHVILYAVRIANGWE